MGNFRPTIIGHKGPVQDLEDLKAYSKLFPDHAFAGRYDFDEETVAKRICQMRIEDPYPSSPTRPPRHGIWIKTSYGRAYHNFHATYAALHTINYLIGDEKVKWASETEIIAGDVSIMGEASTDLEKIMDYDFKKGEAEWELPANARRELDRLLGRSARHEPRGAVSEQPHVKREAIKRSDGNTPADIAEKLNMEPGKVRQRLRKLNIPKPYIWDDEQLEEILAKIKKS